MKDRDTMRFLCGQVGYATIAEKSADMNGIMTLTETGIAMKKTADTKLRNVPVISTRFPEIMKKYISANAPSAIRQWARHTATVSPMQLHAPHAVGLRKNAVRGQYSIYHSIHTNMTARITGTDAWPAIQSCPTNTPRPAPTQHIAKHAVVQ